MNDSRVLHAHHAVSRRAAFILHIGEMRSKITYFSLHEREAGHEQGFIVSFHLIFFPFLKNI